MPYTGWRHTNVRAISNHVSHKNGAERFSAIFLGSFGDKQATAEFPDEKNSTIGPTFGVKLQTIEYGGIFSTHGVQCSGFICVAAYKVRVTNASASTEQNGSAKNHNVPSFDRVSCQ